MSRVLLGTQYYRPPNPEPELWLTDFEQMKDIGLSLVRYWIFWSDVNPHEGEWNWSALDQLFDLAGGHGMGVVAQFIPENQPDWFVKANSGVSRIDRNGYASQLLGEPMTTWGRYPGLTVEHPQVVEGTESFIAAVVERYRLHPALYAWDVWNEVQASDVSFDLPTEAAWQAWLEGEYGEIKTLCDVVQTRFESFQDIPLIRRNPVDAGRGSAALQVIFQRWLAHRAVTEMDRRAGIVRALDSSHLVVSHRGSRKHMEPFVDEVDLVKSLDVWGASNFNSEFLTSHDYRDLAQNLAALRGSSVGRRFWLAETGAGGMYHFYGHHLPSAAEVKTALLLSYAHGADCTMYWQYRHERFGQEVTGWGLVNYDGSSNERVDVTRQMAQSLTRADGSMARPVSTFGVLYDPDVLRFEATMGEWVEPGVTMVDECAGWYAAALEGGASPEVVTPSRIREYGVPGELSVLVLPMHIFEDRACEVEILRWVSNGGTAIATAYSGMMDSEFIAGRSVPVGPIGEVLGARVVSRSFPNEFSFTVSRPNESDLRMSGYWVAEEFRIVDADVIGEHDGKPIAVSRSHGRGRVIHIGTLAGTAYLRGDPRLRSWIRDSLPQADGTAIHLVDGTFAERLTGDSGETLCVFNPSLERVTVSFESTPGATVYDNWDGRPVEVDEGGRWSVDLPPRDCAWLVVTAPR